MFPSLLGLFNAGCLHWGTDGGPRLQEVCRGWLWGVGVGGARGKGGGATPNATLSPLEWVCIQIGGRVSLMFYYIAPNGGRGGYMAVTYWQCPLIQLLKRNDSRSGIEPTTVCLPAYRLPPSRLFCFKYLSYHPITWDLRHNNFIREVAIDYSYLSHPYVKTFHHTEQTVFNHYGVQKEVQIETLPFFFFSSSFLSSFPRLMWFSYSFYNPKSSIVCKQSGWLLIIV